VEGVDFTAVKTMVEAALLEDGALEDTTVEYAGLTADPVRADLVAGAEGVVCGMEIVQEVFRQMDDGIRFDAAAKDGKPCRDGDVLCRIEGPANSILAAERTALNFLQRLSGISTLAAEFTHRVSGTGVTILDTRKTTPLWRDLEKYAVRCGGASNHRRDLRAMVLVKENHVRAIGGPEALIKRIEQMRDKHPGFVEVEVDSLEFLEKILGSPFDRVMLDNFSPAQVDTALRIIAGHRRRHPDMKLEVEVSGGVTPKNVAQYAKNGVDFISIGALTHSAPALSMSLEVV
jgi:nicotinate-nucleotide pyrophosphorylase (carboxylating)